MQINSRKFTIFLSLLLCLSFAGAALAGTTDTKKKKKKSGADVEGSAEPDKVLYNRAMIDYKKGKYTEERLTLQTLINTYPDSEYLAKAKLGIGDSYYKEGGVTNLTQSIAEYKDFITFFPFLDESAYAQMQVGMAHYRMMEKADRDTSQAQAAENEFQTFLVKYPNSPLAAKAKQHLRDVQEVLADGEFRIASFYYLKGIRSYRAALARLNEVIERYPLYSQSDRALWMAGNIYDKAERRETADQLFARIVREYPSSHYVPDARRKLMAAGVPVPTADANAIAVSAKNKTYAEKRASVMRKGTGLIRTGPDVTHAAHAGEPNLTPPDDNQSATDVLRPGVGGPTFSTGSRSGTGNSIAVQTVQPNGGTDVSGAQPIGPANTPPIAAPPPDAGNSAPTSSDASSLPAPMNSEGGSATPDTGAAQPTGADTAANSPARPVVDSKEDTSTASDAEAAAAASAPEKSGAAPAPTPNPNANAPAANTTNTQSSSGDNSANNPNSTKATSSEQAAPASGAADPNTESSSKKKKGIKKIIPW